MKERLHQLRSRKFIGAVELADEAARLVADMVPRQDRASVAEVPDERIVRYYSTEGLISAPEGRQGTAAVYGYTHLLQLLVIKRLQADHLPIRKIRELVEGKSIAELERLLGADQKQSAARSKNSASEFLQSLVTSYSMKSADPAVINEPVAASYASPSGRLAWTRVEIEPGLELHLRDDYRLPDDARERQRLSRRIMAEIEHNGSEPRK